MSKVLDDQHWLETYRSLIALSTEGFKFAALSNGGAAVALLAYLGNVASDGRRVADMRWPMACYLLGLLACGFALLFAYLTQLRLLNDARTPAPLWPSHQWLLWTSFLLYVLSLVSFAVGSWQAVLRFG